MIRSFKYLKIVYLNFGKSDKANKIGWENLIKALEKQIYLEDF